MALLQYLPALQTTIATSLEKSTYPPQAIHKMVAEGPVLTTASQSYIQCRLRNWRPVVC